MPPITPSSSPSGEPSVVRSELESAVLELEQARKDLSDAGKAFRKANLRYQKALSSARQITNPLLDLPPANN